MLSFGLAILKYRLYDVDVVISRTLVYGTLAASIGLVYVGVVAGVGAMLGTRGEPNLVLSLVATAAVALAFQPLRERLQRLANRLVYGQRATPYAVLAGFSHRIGSALSLDEVLPQMAEAVGHGVGAMRSRVARLCTRRRRPDRGVAGGVPRRTTSSARPRCSIMANR